MSDLSEESLASDPPYVPSGDDLNKITKTRAKRKLEDFGSKTSKHSKPTQSKTQKSPVKTVSQKYERRQDQKKRQEKAQAKTEERVEELKVQIEKNKKKKEEDDKVRQFFLKAKQSDKGKQSDKQKAKTSAKAMATSQLKGGNVAVVDEPSTSKVTHKKQRTLPSMIEPSMIEDLAEDLDISDIEALPENSDEETHMSSDDNRDYVKTPKKKPRRRAKTSIIWNHVHRRAQEPGFLFCNYCKSKWDDIARGNSTSSCRTHLLQHHSDRFTPEEWATISQRGESSGVSASGEKLPPRSLTKTLRPGMVLPRSSSQHQDRLLGKWLVTSAGSFNTVDNKEFSDFCQSLMQNYCLPSRGYLQQNVVAPMYDDSLKYVQKLIGQSPAVALTCDLWTSLNTVNYLTITAHVIDGDDKLQAYCLDTSPLKDRHTSENLQTHILKKLKEFGLYKENLGLRQRQSRDVGDETGDDDDDDGNEDYLTKELTAEEDKCLEETITEN